MERELCSRNREKRIFFLFACGWVQDVADRLGRIVGEGDEQGETVEDVRDDRVRKGICGQS